MARERRWTTAASAGLALLPAGYLVREAIAQHLDTPYWDGWTLGPLILAHLDGQLTWQALLAPHNGHRPAVLRALLIWLATRTGWDASVEVAVAVAIGIAAAALAIGLLVRVRPAGGRLAWWAVPAASALLLSMNQWENWLWGWQAGVFLALVGAYGVVLLLARPPVGVVAVAASMVLAVVASLSFANGLLAWAIGLALVWRHGGDRRHAYAAAWACVTVLVLAVYVPGLGETTVGGRASVAAVVLLFLRYVGAPVANGLGAAASATAGVVGLAAFAWSAWCARGTRAWWPAMALAAFGLASGLMVAVGRAGFLDGPEVPTKYVTFATVFWFALLVVWATAPPIPTAAPAVVLLVAAAASSTAWLARPTYEARNRPLVAARAALLSAGPDGLLVRFFPAPEFLRELLPQLRARRLAVFACDDRPARVEWARVTQTLRRSARAGDEVIASSDWGAACLAGWLGASPTVRVVSAGESADRARAAWGAGAGHFFLTGGDAVSPDAREVMAKGFPLWHREGGALGVYYAPDRVAFLRERAPEAWLSADEAALRAVPPVGAVAAGPFLLDGWGEPEVDRGTPFRWAVARRAELYVPVVKSPPARLTLDVSPLALPGVHQSVDVEVNGRLAGRVDLKPGGNLVDLDLSGADWTFGFNRVSLVHATADSPSTLVPGEGDTRTLAAMYRVVAFGW